MFLKANQEDDGPMMFLLLIALAALAAILVVLARTIVGDGYGLRPPPRSHHAEEEFDAWGFPLKYVDPR
jgi:hypothetical protein